MVDFLHQSQQNPPQSSLGSPLSSFILPSLKFCWNISFSFQFKWNQWHTIRQDAHAQGTHTEVGKCTRRRWQFSQFLLSPVKVGDLNEIELAFLILPEVLSARNTPDPQSNINARISVDMTCINQHYGCPRWPGPMANKPVLKWASSQLTAGPKSTDELICKKVIAHVAVPI